MSTRPGRASEDDPAHSTIEVIAEARRPLLIERHRQLVGEMEASLADSLVTGQADNPRLKAMLKELEADSERARIQRTLRILSEDQHYREATVRDALIDELCLLREQGSIEIAMLQMHVIGVYREILGKLTAAQGEAPSLGDIREVPVTMIARILNPREQRFGTPELSDCLIYTPAFGQRALRMVNRLRKTTVGDRHWHESAGDPTLDAEAEERLSALPEPEREKARQAVVRDRIRSRFYRDIFLKFLSPDELDPHEVESHPTVLRWLEAIEETPHLYPFMQGQTQQQKIFRLAQLQQKIIQMHEVYARIAAASEHPTYREQFSGKNSRERLAAMVKDHYPPLPLSLELTIAAMLCPLRVFVAWVQDKVAAHDFVLPPDPRGK
jgi:hypothetical protein